MTPIENFDELYSLYAPLLYGYILTEISDETVADHLFAETFVEAFSCMHHYDAEKLRFYSWLRQIAARQMKMHRKKPAVLVQ